MNATKIDEEISSDHKLTNCSLSQQTGGDKSTTTTFTNVTSTVTVKPSSGVSRKVNTNVSGNGSYNFLASLYSRCIRNSSRRMRKQTINSNHHQSTFCLNFCGYRSSDAASRTGASETPRRESNTYSFRYPTNGRRESSVSLTGNNSLPPGHFGANISISESVKTHNSSPSPSTTALNTTASVLNNSGQANSNNNSPTTNNSVHMYKSERIRKLPSDKLSCDVVKNDTTEHGNINIATPLSMTALTNTKSSTADLIITKNVSYNKSQGNLPQISSTPVQDSSKLCARCQRVIDLVNQDSKQIFSSTDNPTDTKINNTTCINTTTTTTNHNNNNTDSVGPVNRTNKSNDKVISKKVEEIESAIVEYEKHVKYMLNHIHTTKEQYSQSSLEYNFGDDKNKCLWDAFNTITPNHDNIFRPSHNDINTFHVDDDIDYEERKDEVNEGYRMDAHLNTNNNSDTRQQCHQHHRHVNRLTQDDTAYSDIQTPNNISDEKRIIKIYRQLHNLRCQIESFSYLSWLGLASEPPTNKVLVPGADAPSPNPQMHLIRRSDADSRRNIQEFRRLCKEPVSEEDLLELRSSTFNNWSRTDSQLMRLVREMFKELGFIEHYKLQYHRLDLWLSDIYRRYNRIPFHNYKHAFMVTQMCYVLLWGGNLTKLLDIDDQLTLIMSAICHDLDHPGFNNAYQINAGTVLAMRYNDQSPLENHHSAVAFDLLSHAEVDPFAHLPFSVRQRIRKGMIRCILATDMSRHNEILDEFNRVVLGDLQAAWEIDTNTKKPVWVTNKTQKDLVMIIILKISDISNEARPLNVAGPWINRLLAEFFNQSDYEKLVGLPVAPFMDRHKVTKSASQCGFIRFVILPLFESLAKLLPEVKVSMHLRLEHFNNQFPVILVFIQLT
ncbi:unnamed protein product [Heterobilharzia americana]|nr:unnamed protein product [Heterobilharzia americana]